jgi:hypothetical protein
MILSCISFVQVNLMLLHLEIMFRVLVSGYYDSS